LDKIDASMFLAEKEWFKCWKSSRKGEYIIFT
jgi:hypothetical protein